MKNFGELKFDERKRNMDQKAIIWRSKGENQRFDTDEFER